MQQFFWGMLTMAGVTIAALFFRYWRVTRDRLFLLFSLAFLAFAMNWLSLAIVEPTAEASHYIYVTRLMAFGLIAAAVLDKNRRRS